jgi:hypothetical protein
MVGTRVVAAMVLWQPIIPECPPELVAGIVHRQQFREQAARWSAEPSTLPSLYPPTTRRSVLRLASASNMTHRPLVDLEAPTWDGGAVLALLPVGVIVNRDGPLPVYLLRPHRSSASSA